MGLKRSFKMTELGPLPEEWEVVRLGEVCNIQIGRTPKRKIQQYWASSDVPWVSIKDLVPFGTITNTSEKISEKAFKEVFNERLVSKGTLLMSFKLTIGRTSILGIDAVHNEAIVSLYPTQKVLKEFLLYYLPTVDYNQYQDKAVKGNTLNKEKIKNLKISLPPLPEQKAIARVLRMIQDAIEATDKVIESAKELRKGLMRHLFTYGPVPIAERDKVRLKQTEIGPIPEDWEVVRLGEVANTFSGGTPSRKNPSYWNGDIPWAKSGDLKDTFVRSVEESISEEGLKNSSAKIVSADTLLIAMYGATAGKVGIAGFDFAINQAICAIIPKKQPKTFKSLFGFYYLIYTRDKLLAERFGGAQPNLNQQIIRNFLIPLPPLPVQQKIAQILKSVDDKIEAEEKRKEALQALFKTMLHHLMTGKIRVKPSS